VVLQIEEVVVLEVVKDLLGVWALGEAQVLQRIFSLVVVQVEHPSLCLLWHFVDFQSVFVMGQQMEVGVEVLCSFDSRFLPRRE
jgi:hypothetical protein